MRPARRRRDGDARRGLRRRLRRGVAGRRRDPRQPDRHDPDARRAPRGADLRARPRLHRRRRAPAGASRSRPARPPTRPRSSRRGCRSARMFDIVWSGKRHVMMGATQIDRFGNQNIACIGPWAKPKAQLLGVRGAPGNTVNHPTSYWVPQHGPRVFVEQVDCVSGVGYDRAAAAGPIGERVPRDPPSSCPNKARPRLRDARPLDAAPFGAPGRDRRRGRREHRLRARRARRRPRDARAHRRGPAAHPRGPRPRTTCATREVPSSVTPSRRCTRRSATCSGSSTRSCRRAWAGSPAPTSPRRRATPAGSASSPAPP